MQRFLTSLLLVCSSLLAATSAFAKTDQQTIVLISIDGFRYNYIEQHHAEHLSHLAEQGVRAKGLMPVYPSKTFPNHLSIVTGQYPSHHGIVDNNFYDTERKQRYKMADGAKDGTWLHTVPIWNLAEFQGVKSATFFWPESGARINGRTPTYYYPYSNFTPNQQRVDQIIQWLQLPEQSRPRMITGYFSIVDSMGHKFGPDSKQTKGAVQAVDKLIGQLWQRIQNETEGSVNLIVVSDHGMAPIKADAMIDPDDLAIDEEKFTTVNSQTRYLIYANEDTSADDIAALRAQLEDSSDLGYRVETDNKLKQLHVSDGPRKPAIVLSTDAPVSFATRPVEERSDGGTHGYYNNRDMDGLFVAVGPAFKNGVTIDRFENIHIYPLMADILDLKLMTQIDGEIAVLKPILNN
ncbi:ectonucleotide pyrophosphatase/phosphodiesterase [Idiomarina baltica]|jgi:predicted AlkP superfamily pyrophosphatase or phosphodiesterase|uniref:Phosphodiesterase-nucleotide pyrophosphatase related protein, AP superfamily protein n=1 Tax=Idiomarina baltica OS145 TaxID=314276 RepID=A0ABM9WNL1_9GAMM|nr:ectonucleotide pyrophosphatase/phosphodiesterase [Idiomarina baltica]EAQ32530.1 Phosphodiesterase-nucleotide pyrophosphatase related protein, AP superfamily protein [Idiomarina baltica OS145]